MCWGFLCGFPSPDRESQVPSHIPSLHGMMIVGTKKTVHMSNVHNIQERMGFPPLQKIDANTGDVKDQHQDGRQRLGQAAIPAALAILAKYAASESGLQRLSAGPVDTNWLKEILGTERHAVVRRVAEYAGADPATASRTMQEAIQLAVHQGVHLNEANEASPAQQAFYAGLLTEALTYLPAAVPIGKAMEDNTLDDQTHKMEGPLSSLAHKIENVFSDIRSEDPKDAK